MNELGKYYYYITFVENTHVRMRLCVFPIFLSKLKFKCSQGHHIYNTFWFKFMNVNRYVLPPVLSSHPGDKMDIAPI